MLFIVWYSSVPDEWHVRIASLGNAHDPNASPTWWLIALRGTIMDVDLHGAFHATQPGTEPAILTRLDVLVFYPFLHNLVADFFALIFTQKILATFSMPPATTIRGLIFTFLVSACLLLALAFCALLAAGIIISHIVNALMLQFVGTTLGVGPLQPYVGNFVTAVLFPFYKNRPDEWNVATIYGVFVWSTLMGILWIGIFSTSVIIANVSMKLQGLGPWLNRNFRVRSRPFRILGVLMVILLFVACAIYHAFV
jgi:hypothetical protein